MSWFWLGLLVLAGLVLWLRRRHRLQRDAMLQESLDHLGAEAEPKRPPAKQPWRRPGFGPAPRMDALNLGSGPRPPAAGSLENPDLAGPLPDDEDLPALLPIDVSDIEPPADDKPPPPPPPPPPPGVDEVTPKPELSMSERPQPEEPRPIWSALAGLDAEDETLDGDLAPIRGPELVELPPELAAEVRNLMRRHQEVAAVRLVCDTMGVGILDAQLTVRTLVGR